MRVVLVIVLAFLGAPAALAQDAAAGGQVFGACRGCHAVGPGARNGIGPQLNGLFGRKAGSVEGYAYSPANRDAGLTWDEANFADYIKDPRARMPGTKMIYAGLKEEARIANLIAYLKGFDAAGAKTAP